MNFINLFSVPISITSRSQALALTGEWLKEWKEGLGIEARKSSIQTPAHFPKLIVTPNPEMIVSAQSDPEFLKALREADLAIPDGVGIIWALKLLWKGKSGLGREARNSHLFPFQHLNPNLLSIRALSGLDLMESLISEFSRTLPQGLSPRESPLKVMLLGGRPGIAQLAADILQKENTFLSNSYLFPFQHLNLNRLSIRALSGPQDISHISKSDNDQLIAQINSFSPDLLFVAFGHPRQEKWLTENRERLTVGVATGVGGAFDQLADPSLRPPTYINSIWLGWLYRLLRQPWRLKRQLTLVKFVGMVFRQKLQIPISKRLKIGKLRFH